MNKITEVKVKLNEVKGVVDKSVTEHNIIAENDNFYVLDDDWFTKLEKRNDKYKTYHTPEVVSVREETSSKTMIDLFGRFSITLYSTKSLKVIENKINREFNKWLKEKVGIYGTPEEVKIKL